ncbi:uncharacterized protein LOC113506004 [Trichoplusia ni]|uniref:Uncharacterized protein LOC113506004 n=1 Tax=Trichoplusia ni TaxID=7111 RepID=A0A7E5WVV7_TRINI|nr:uncharacterized protein LOC113506004 [Trichoplusia ni]
MENNNIVKCNQCNVVINELLCFIQHKIDVMDNFSLIQICKSAFSEDVIRSAKNLLFQAVPNIKHAISKNKAGRELEDIIDLLKVTDPDIVPVFVARNLHVLPPISWDHVDVCSLLKIILILESEVSTVKKNYATTKFVEEMYGTRDTQPMDQTIIESGDCKVNRCRGVYVLEESSYLEICDRNINKPQSSSSPNSGSTTGAPASSSRMQKTFQGHPVSITSCAPVCANEKSAKSVSLAQLPEQARAQYVEARNCTTAVSTLETQVNEANRRVQEPALRDSDTDEHASATEIARTWVDVAKEGEWKEVVNKRRLYNKNRFIGIKGKAMRLSECKFKAAEIKIPFYIYNVHKDASPQDINEYVFARTNVEITPEKMIMKQAKGYEAYKFLIPKDKLCVFMDENLWPDGVSFRQFVTISNYKGQTLKTGININRNI